MFALQTFYSGLFQLTAARRRLVAGRFGFVVDSKFQLTAARRRLVYATPWQPSVKNVSTHSRPKAAGGSAFHDYILLPVSTHSRPKAAGMAIWPQT